jgi:hypothetical protein
MLKRGSAILLVCAATSAFPASPPDPSIGSYLYFVALDARCPEPSAARTAALEQFKQHFIAGFVKFLPIIPPPDRAKAARMLEGIKKNGPPAEDLKAFDSLFARWTPQEIAKLCQSAPTDIAERIAIEKLVSESAERMKAQADRAPGSSPMTENTYPSREELERDGPPFGFLSIQHFYAILKRCETVSPAPEGVQARERAFNRLLDGAMTMNGLWRTFYDAEGRLKETRFPNPRAMVASPEFAQDIKRYEERESRRRLADLQEQCAQFESLVSMAMPGKK